MNTLRICTNVADVIIVCPAAIIEFRWYTVLPDPFSLCIILLEQESGYETSSHTTFKQSQGHKIQVCTTKMVSSD